MPAIILFLGATLALLVLNGLGIINVELWVCLLPLVPLGVMLVAAFVLSVFGGITAYRSAKAITSGFAYRT